MSESASRRLFLAEFLLALPSLGFLAAWALASGVGAAIGALAFLWHSAANAGAVASLADLWAFLQIVGLLLGGIAVAILGLVAIGKFLTVALGFWKEGLAGLEAARRHLLPGLACAILPLALMTRIAWVTVGREEAADWLFAFYMSGLVLLPPILHLWLELRRTPDAARLRSKPGP